MIKLWRNCPRLLALALCFVLVAQAALGQQGQQALRIVPVEGAGAKNVVQQISARPIVVRVEDSTGKPVVGARVVFISPQTGASGEFSNDARTLEATTNARGEASAGNYHPNSLTGPYKITVRADFQGQMNSIDINQENVQQGTSHKKVFIILGIAGAAVAAILASSLKKSSPPTTPSTSPTITLGGTSTVGAPSNP